MRTLSVILFISFLMSSCANHGQLTFITKLPKKLDENSGIVHFKDSTVWFAEDNGNDNSIYQVDFKGNLQKKLEVKNAKNKDWEDLTKDKDGNLYIGDFGNNSNERKNLVIYKIPNPELEQGNKINAEAIKFRYPEQKKFPPKKNALLYDAEAMFHHGNHLYIITKNRANPFTGIALIYKIPAKKGTYRAEYIGKITTCTDWNTCKVSSADISPNEKTIVLLGYGKLWIIRNFTFDNFSDGDIQELELGIRTQLESVCFTDDKVLLLSDEKRGNTGRNLYSYTLE